MKINIAHDSFNYHNLYESTKDDRYRTASQWLEFSFEYPTIKTVDHFLNTDERFVYEIGTQMDQSTGVSPLMANITFLITYLKKLYVLCIQVNVLYILIKQWRHFLYTNILPHTMIQGL